MDGKFSNYALDIIAPELSLLTEDNTIDLFDIHESEYWLNCFILNSMFRFKIAPTDWQYVFNIIRKTQAGIHEYENARSNLSQYINSDRNTISPYFKSLMHFEYCIAQMYQAFLLIRGLVGLDKLFEKNDGSHIGKLNLLYNESKHIETGLISGQIPVNNSIPVWITNYGIKSYNALLIYKELAGFLNDLSEIAQMLCKFNIPITEGYSTQSST